MNITFYWVPGLSEVDTPVFSTKAEQTTFFAEQERYVISSGFYPPFFRNKVKVDVTDYNLTTSISNYCSIEYDSKVFYYFIISKNYISEDIVELDLKMDVIQTYMFDVNFISALVERHTINRWQYTVDQQGHTVLSDKINRNYIRENFSSGSFTVCKYYNELNTNGGLGDDSKFYWTYVIKVSKNLPGSGSTEVGSSIMLIDGSTTVSLSSPYAFGFTPASGGTYIDSNQQSHIINVSTITQTASTQDRIVDAYLIPMRSVNNFRLTVGYHIELNAAYVENMSSTATADMIFSTTVSIYVNRGSTSILRNYDIPSIGDLFKSYRNPVMLDENYVKFSIGDPTVRSEYPLYNLETNTLSYAFWCDITNGARYYNLFLDTIFDNKYNSIAINATALKLDLKNDPWEKYISQNQATLMGSTAVSTVNLLTSTIAGGIKGGNEGAAAGAVTGAGGVINNNIKYITNEQNLKHAPDSIKRLGSAIGDVLGGEAVISIRTYYCDNFNEVAIFYESYGYKVMKWVPDNLFTYHKRYLYDYIKTRELHIAIGDLATENEFIRRFNEGLRLWHTSEGVLVCEDYNIEMGQVCILDNSEYI